MKILKLLNKNYLTIFIISIFFLINPLNAEDEPIDIWELEKIIGPDENQLIIEEDDLTSDSIIKIENNLNIKIKTLKKESLGAENIKLAGLYDPVENGLIYINKLRGVTFQWKESSGYSMGTVYGLIAQEVEEILPDLVAESGTKLDDDTKSKTINYNGVIPILIEAVKELSDKVTVLENA